MPTYYPSYPFIIFKEQIKELGLPGAFVFNELFNTATEHDIINDGFYEVSVKDIFDALDFIDKEEVSNGIEKILEDGVEGFHLVVNTKFDNQGNVGGNIVITRKKQ